MYIFVSFVYHFWSQKFVKHQGQHFGKSLKNQFNRIKIVQIPHTHSWNNILRSNLKHLKYIVCSHWVFDGIVYCRTFEGFFVFLKFDLLFDDVRYFLRHGFVLKKNNLIRSRWQELLKEAPSNREVHFLISVLLTFYHWRNSCWRNYSIYEPKRKDLKNRKIFSFNFIIYFNLFYLILERLNRHCYYHSIELTSFARGQSYKVDLFLSKNYLDINSLTVHYLNLDYNSKVVESEFKLHAVIEFRFLRLNLFYRVALQVWLFEGGTPTYLEASYKIQITLVVTAIDIYKLESSVACVINIF
jgi:hypothetical protein